MVRIQHQTYISIQFYQIIQVTIVVLISVIDSVGGSTTIGTFTMPGNTVEFVEKKSTEAIFEADTSVLGSAVGYSIS